MLTIDVETLLRTLGIVARYESSSHRWVASCPSPDHVEDEPSWSIIDQPDSKKHGSHYCFGCKFRGGPWELAAAIWACSIKDAGKRLFKLYKGRALSKEVPKVVIQYKPNERRFQLPFGVTIPDNGGRWFQPALHYLHSRGITDEQIVKWGIGYSVKGRLVNRVVFPVYTEGALRTFSARAITKSLHRYEQGRVHEGAQPRRALFGEPYFDHSLGVVTVAEGIPSALALERIGAINPSAMIGSVLTPERARIISRFKSIIVASDPDKAGDHVAEWIYVLSRRSTVKRLELDVAPDDMDPDLLRKNYEKVLRNINL
jgi:DNA primase